LAIRNLALAPLHINFILTVKNSTLLPGLANARQTIGPPAVTKNFCHLINNTAFYLDSPIAQLKIHVLTAKSQFL
jgi:hypothetical protein